MVFRDKHLKHSFFAPVIVLASVVLISFSVHAAELFQDDYLENIRAYDRVPTDLKSQPIQWKGLQINALLNTNAGYDSNIYSSNTDEEGDFIFEMTPEIQITKKFNDHVVGIKADYTHEEYLENPDEAASTYNVDMRSILKATSQLSLPFKIFQKTTKIGRSTPGSTQFTDDPVTVARQGASAGLEYRFNRLKTALTGFYRKTDFENGTSSLTGQDIIFQDKNYTETGAILENSYDILGADSSADHRFFTRLSYSKQDFDETPDENGVVTAQLQNNQQYGVLAGFVTQYKGLLEGKLAFGYFQRDYDQDEDVNRLDIDFDLAFNLSPKTTLGLIASREVNQDNSILRGYVDTSAQLALDYELRHNVLFGALAGWKNMDFLDDTNREDDTYNAGLRMKYIHSPRFTSEILANYITRGSSESANEFDKYYIGYTLKTHF